MASDLRFHWESDPSSSEEPEGEDIEGVEYAPRSVDGSESGRSLADFLQDEDCASIQGPSFYRAFNNEKSLSPAYLPRGLPNLLSKKRPAPGYLPTSPFAWSCGSAFRQRTCITPPSCNSQVPSSSRVLQSNGGKKGSSQPSAGDCSQSLTLRRRGLVKKRRRVILSQE
ncbi:hypothetical protein KFL_003860050 [Klebsormidium nitens]|uniref:Uncharacterized protein n=1 Tax=Klebsormidium nitens TaxID=105231 RepID=A0A1Y1IEP0_KLENI|nr:hypothetical protein KFL_003860050 [Klebsormidium nitens]|eukprot:GAQ87899.1 hypothetical protein KFL_003860050 [Klebsormidium nitens]